VFPVGTDRGLAEHTIGEVVELLCHLVSHHVSPPVVDLQPPTVAAERQRLFRLAEEGRFEYQFALGADDAEVSGVRAVLGRCAGRLRPAVEPDREGGVLVGHVAERLVGGPHLGGHTDGICVEDEPRGVERVDTQIRHARVVADEVRIEAPLVGVARDRFKHLLAHAAVNAHGVADGSLRDQFAHPADLRVGLHPVGDHQRHVLGGRDEALCALAGRLHGLLTEFPCSAAVSAYGRWSAFGMQT
jgi:hypothetical protein